jgi:predicted lipoprotein with Yx(FWY)xxD motif
MVRTSPQRRSTWRISAGRMAAVILALGGMSALAFASTAAAAAPTQTTATEIDTAKNSQLGTYLTAGNTVYILKPSKVACTAKCLKAWPPVLLPAGVTAATAGTGVDSSKLGTVSTPSGLQITYGGKALYWYVKDKAPGQVKGNIKDKWGKWVTVVTVKGKGGSGGSKKTNSGTGGTAF